MLQITDKGIHIDDFDTIYSRLVEAFKGIYGQNVNLDSDTPDGQLLGLFTQELSNIHKAVIFIVQMMDPYQARGNWLEQRAMYAGLIRNKASYSYIDDVIITGKPKTNIPYETVVIDSNQNKWIVEEKELLNDLGSARIKLRSQELGDYKVKKGDEFTLSTIIVGIDKLIANSDSYGGADEELDSDFLNRFMMSHSVNNNDDRSGLQAALANITGVKKCVVYENYTAFIDEKGIAPHSANAVILGGESKKIAEVITKNKIGGCGLFGQMEENYSYKGDVRRVKYDRPNKLNVSVRLVIARYKEFHDIDTDSIKENLQSLDFTIGERVYASRIISDINLTQGFYIKELTVNGASLVNVDYREYAEISDVEVLIDD